MCGICGFVAAKGPPPDAGVLAAMTGCLAHRGPDGQGTFLDPFPSGGGAALGHRRLAIIDLATGDQPLFNEDGRLAIVFNGEIYNFPELRAELESRGHVFRTKTDTEAIVHLYEDMGPECVARLRGMFALAVWDKRERELFLARDRFGKKPLYFAKRGETLVFGSEPKAVLAHPAVPKRLDPAAVAHYLTLQHVPEPMTGFAGIETLPPAHWLFWKDGRVRQKRYWRLSFLPKLAGSERDLAEELKARVTEAVRCRLISDVPLGAHLSGGVDSGIVTAVMAGLCDGPVKTFSIAFAEEAFSEADKARQVARLFGTEHTDFILGQTEAADVMAAVIRHTDMPLADPSSLAVWHLARLTREHVTVALNGDGGDEVFAGYQRYWLDPLADLYSRLPGFVTRRLVPWLAARLPAGGEVPVEADWRAGLKRLAQVAAISGKASLVRWGSYFAPDMRQTLLQAEFAAAAGEADTVGLYAAAFDAAQADARLDRALAADQAVYLPGDLLVKADRMAMAHGLEGRSPFLDVDLAEWAARLPVKLKLRGRTGKYLLRKAFADVLPPDLAGQPKRGFGLPVGKWFREGMRPFVFDLLTGGRVVGEVARPQAVAQLLSEHEAGREDHGKRLFALLMLELWLRAFSL